MLYHLLWLVLWWIKLKRFSFSLFFICIGQRCRRKENYLSLILSKSTRIIWCRCTCIGQILLNILFPHKKIKHGGFTPPMQILFHISLVQSLFISHKYILKILRSHWIHLNFRRRTHTNGKRSVFLMICMGYTSLKEEILFVWVSLLEIYHPQ